MVWMRASAKARLIGLPRRLNDPYCHRIQILRHQQRQRSHCIDAIKKRRTSGDRLLERPVRAVVESDNARGIVA
jgi:hypothetical protein